MRTDRTLSRRQLLAGLAALPLVACGSSGPNAVPLGSGPLSVLVLFKGPVVPDVIGILQAQPTLFDIVDAQEVATTTPPLTQLTASEVVLLVGDGPNDDEVALGNVLASYVDVGGGLVIADVDAMWTGPWGLDGTFDGADYHAIPETVFGTPERRSDAARGIVLDDPVHPIVTGAGLGSPIPTGVGAYGTFRPATALGWLATVPGAAQIAHWDDGASSPTPNANTSTDPTPLIVTREVFPSTGVIARRVDLGLVAASNSPRGGIVHPDAHRIYVNALLWVGYRI